VILESGHKSRGRPLMTFARRVSSTSASWRKSASAASIVASSAPEP
jgi:hypothetical protein